MGPGMGGVSSGRHGEALQLIEYYAAIAGMRDDLIVATMGKVALDIAVTIPRAVRTTDRHRRPVALFVPGAQDGSTPPYLALATDYLDLLATLPPWHDDLPDLVIRGLTALAEAVVLRDDQRAALMAFSPR